MMGVPAKSTNIRRLTSAVAKLLGFAAGDLRSSEITIGSGLSLVDGELSADVEPGIGGTTGSTANAVPRADGTGGSTLKGSAITITDAGMLVVKQAAGVAGVDELQISHDGTKGLIESKDGDLWIGNLGHDIQFGGGYIAAQPSLDRFYMSLSYMRFGHLDLVGKNLGGGTLRVTNAGSSSRGSALDLHAGDEPNVALEANYGRICVRNAGGGKLKLSVYWPDGSVSDVVTQP